MDDIFYGWSFICFGRQYLFSCNVTFWHNLHSDHKIGGNGKDHDDIHGWIKNYACVQALARNRKMLYITGMKLQWFQWWDFQNFQSQIIPDIPDSLCIVNLFRKLEEVKFDSIIGWYFPPKNCQIGIFFNYKNPFVNNIYLSYKYISEFTIVKCNRKFLWVFLLLLQRWRMLKLEKFL